MGVSVYATSRGRIIHASPDCVALKHRARGWAERDLDDIEHPDLCKHCWPEQPRLRVAHRQCCGSMTLPCRHNGGVLVRMERRVGYVWPEDAHRYTLVNPVHIP